jgi:hypothetical protein
MKPQRAVKLPEIEVFADVEQGSPEWWALRLGIPTASRFAAVCATGKDGTVAGSLTRSKLMRVLAGEILTGEPSEQFTTAAMDRGNAMEAEARDYYARTHFAELTRVGFIRRRLPSGRFVGCSPDSLVGKGKALEIKTARPDIIIEIGDKGTGFPPEHRAQVQGTMWVADLDVVDLMIYYRGMPYAPMFTVLRDDVYIRELSDSVEIFDWELHKLVERERAKGEPK